MLLHFLCMSGVQLGDEIAIHYRLEDSQGNLVAVSGADPVPMRVGSQDVIIGVSCGVMGMQIDEVKALHLRPEQAFGSDHKSVERIVDKGDLPAETVVGDQIRLRYEDVCVTVWVLAEAEGAWRITTKHPACGLNMAITVKLVAHKG